MKKDNFKVFLIIEGLNTLVRIPITTFVCKDREQAKLYFQKYIKDLKTSTYSLFEIMEITPKELKEERIFICSSLNIQSRQITITQERDTIEKAKIEKDKIKALEILFGARKIKNDKEKIS